MIIDYVKDLKLRNGYTITEWEDAMWNFPVLLLHLIKYEYDPEEIMISSLDEYQALMKSYQRNLNYYKLIQNETFVLYYSHHKIDVSCDVKDNNIFYYINIKYFNGALFHQLQNKINN
ncbi:MAG: hypothetical protein RR524_03455 [Erysipelotrichaceae bacterium]